MACGVKSSGGCKKDTKKKEAPKKEKTVKK